jgi:hypothetical protein
MTSNCDVPVEGGSRLAICSVRSLQPFRYGADVSCSRWSSSLWRAPREGVSAFACYGMGEAAHPE